MIIGQVDGMVRVKCSSCGLSNLVPEQKRSEPLSRPGSYSFVPKPTPTCARCLRML